MTALVDAVSFAALADQAEAYRARIRELEGRLEDCEDTLEAIRRGDFDAVVIQAPDSTTQVYTLESADRPYRVLIEQIQEGALTLGRDGAVLYCNPRLAEMLGLRPERLMGRTLGDLVSPTDRDDFARMLAEAARDVVRGELNFEAVDGRALPVHLALSPLDRDDGSPLICGVLTDLTQQRIHLGELADANARLRAESLEREKVEDALRQAQKMEAVGQLTGGIAHDFNNLLTIIKSSTDLLRRPDLAETRRKRYVDAIAETVDRASRLTGQLLAFARRQTLKPEVFDACERVRQTTDMLATIVGSRIKIIRHIPQTPWHVEADISQFETALVNLAVNARDAMDGEGLLTLRVEAETTPGVVAVSLADTGAGIPPEALSRIFEPFFTTKEVGKGTGLGLSQVFGFAKQSGGDVSVVSAVGEGTTFTLTLPAVERSTAEGDAGFRLRGPAQRDTGGGRRVLVVEDNVDVGTFSTQLLQDLGYETTWAASADEALVLLSEGSGRFDIVFSDVVMPGMNGVELGGEIRRLYPDLPVVLTSGYSHVLVQEGHHGFELLKKPYAVEDLSRILRKMARRRSE